jgi:hypothetical protein
MTNRLRKTFVASEWVVSYLYRINDIIQNLFNIFLYFSLEFSRIRKTPILSVCRFEFLFSLTEITGAKYMYNVILLIVNMFQFF